MTAPPGTRVSVVFADGVAYIGSIVRHSRHLNWSLVRFDDGDLKMIDLTADAVRMQDESRAPTHLPGIRVGANYQATLPAVGQESCDRGEKRLRCVRRAGIVHSSSVLGARTKHMNERSAPSG